MNNSFNQNSQQNAWSYYPENVILNVETMTFSKQQPHIQENNFNTKTEQRQTTQNFMPNLNGLFEKLQSNPLLTLLGGKASLNDLLNGGMFNQGGLSQIMNLLSKNNAKEQKKEEDVIVLDAGFEEL